MRPALVLGIIMLLFFLLKNPGAILGGLFNNPLVKYFGALLCIMIISIPFALYRRAAFEFLFLGYINAILFFFIFYKVVDSSKKIKTVLFIGCIGTGLYSIFALVEGGVISGRIFFGEMFDPNDLAFFILSFLPFNLLFLSKDNALLKRFICFSNFVIGLLLILMAASRGGVVAFCVVILVMLLTRTHTIRLIYKVLFVGLILITISQNIVPINFERLRSITNLEEDYNITDETGRLGLWKVGINQMLFHPLTGVGVGCFNEAIGTDREERGLIARWQTAHNSLIQIGTETGLIGLILFALMSLKAFRIFGQVRKKAPSEELVKIGEMARVGFVGHFVSAMFLSQAYSIYWALYIVLSAVLSDLVTRGDESKSDSNVKSILLA
jgi:O-antigen ligase